MPCPEPAPWVELAKAVPSIVTAVTAIYGVRIAKVGLEKWRRETIGKRKAELAEEVLADIYQARDVIQAVRSPANFDDEGSTRQTAEWETENDTTNLNGYFAAIERLNKRSDFFAALYARRYRFIAHFGRDAAKPYDDLHKIYSEIVVAARMLLSAYRRRDVGSLPQKREEWEATIWGIGEDDPIPARLDRIIEAIERTCQPAIRETVQ